MIYDDIKNFNKQFEYEPKVENPAKLRNGAGAAKLKKFGKFLVVGMGGSHIAADILKAWKPDLDLVVWKNYGLPPLKDLKERLIIVSSYSGRTEEAIDAFRDAKAKHLPLAAIGIGGKLIFLSQKFNAPYVQMPDWHMEPRMTLGFSLKSLLALISDKKGLLETAELATKLRPSRQETSGKSLAKKVYGSTPLIYTSSRNEAVAATWKIKFNETGKIPAFYNVLPELNHNEMTGFDIKLKTSQLSRHFHFVFLKDVEDDKRIVRRMNILEKLYHDRGFKVEVMFLQGETRLQKIFSSLNLADWTAYYTAKQYDVDPQEVPMVEEFKKLIAGT